jgi:CheY-like chemotaxis protein
VEPTRTILVVDDIPMFRELESVFLARCGRVVTAEDAAGALEAAERLAPDVIVLDSRLPDLSGADLCRQLKERAAFAATPIVLITAEGSSEEHAEAIRAGADDVLAKPLDRVSLVETVQRFIRFESPRGLPRVTLRTPVRIGPSEEVGWGTICNLSRGGMFIELENGVDVARDLAEEVRLQFRLPERSDAPLAPLARVVWRRAAWAETPGGVGVRFVDLDAPAARALDAYVHERAVERPLPGAEAVRRGSA